MIGLSDIRSVIHIANPLFKEYGEGRMLTGEVKKRLTEVLTGMVERHRMARAAVTEEVKKYIDFTKRLMINQGFVLLIVTILTKKTNDNQMVDAFMAVRPLPNMFE